jgi:2-polyprenyl-3-methyl-5-hydroxy-6-metoxy-1,4-benzoquinol methylase
VDTYIMGRTTGEARRLGIQADLYAPHTEHLLRLAGIRPGLRVVDVGSGMGDVTMQAARLVGPTGHVIGADVDPAMVGVARQRAEESGVDNVTFVQAAIPDIPVDEPVDAVIGRLVLMHLDDPATAVRGLRKLVRPGGIISFQEVDIVHATSAQVAPLAAACMRWCYDAARLAGSGIRGGRLGPILRAAGLEPAGLAVETPATFDPDSPIYVYIASTVASLLPLMVTHDITTAAEVDIDTLLDRLRAEARETRAVAYLPDLVGAWSIEPSAN